jgi:NAD(P)-dependent dehydrogenase (short-subunit alcohol dehydrogenase family)
VAVITGGAGGIGLATARRFAAEGATLVIGNVDETAGMGAADLTNGLFTKVNVTDQDQVDALFDIAFLLYGSVNVAFNNAGISPADNASIELTELPDWHRASDVNLTSVYLCSRAALR